MSAITSLLQRLLEGRNIAEVARATGISHTTLWRIAAGRHHADLRTGDAERLHEWLTGESLVNPDQEGEQ